MSDNFKNKVISISFMFLLIVSLFANTVRAKDDVSYSERRLMYKFPQITYRDIFTKTEWTDKFENYLLDQFIYRDSFRRIKARVVFDIFKQKDNNKIFEINGFVFKIEKQASDKSLERALEKFNEIFEKYLTDNEIYFTFIPDKSYYLSPKHGYLIPDYTKIENLFIDSLGFAKYIDIKNALELESYYRSDIHWCQSGLENVIITLSNEMKFGFEVNSGKNLKENFLYPFFGGYYGQSALKINPDKLIYLTDLVIDGLIARDIAKNEIIPVYDKDKFDSVDPYSFFLGGPVPLVEILNPNADTDRELVIFRDSFTSNIAPILARHYSKITLVDIRYVPVSRLGDFVDFENSEILFMYSFSILGHSLLFR